MSKAKEYFSTYDLNLSAVLLIHGQPLVMVDKDPSGKSIFHFSKSSKLEAIIDKYWRQEILVKPQDLFNSLKALKNRMYSNY